MQNDLVTAKERLMKILQSSDRKSTVRYIQGWKTLSIFFLKLFGHLINLLLLLTNFTQLLEMVERNELNISILTLLDENLASAKTNNQVDELYQLVIKLMCRID